MEFIRDEEKDEIVRRRAGGQGIGFEDIAKAITAGGPDCMMVTQNDSPQYAHQGMYIVRISDYTYKVPFLQISNSTCRLITFYPSRKHKSYL